MTTSSGVPAALSRVDAVRNRAKLLDAARQQVTAGDTTLALNAVARCAGVGVGTAYRHFPDRQSLLEGLAAESFAALVAAAKTAAVEADPAAGLEYLLDAALTAMIRDPVLVEVLTSPAPVCIETIDLSQDFGRAVGDLLRRAHTAGVIQPGISPDDLRRLLVGVHVACRSGADFPTAQKRYLALLLAGLRRYA